MLSKTLTALAEPTRLGAMRILWGDGRNGGEHCVCELMERLGASQSRMSRHMATLKAAGLIVDRRDRQWVRYRVNPELPAEIHAVVAAVMAASAREHETDNQHERERNAA